VPAPLNAFLYLFGVGSKSFVENFKEKLGIRAKGRKVEDQEICIIFVKHRLLTIAILPPKIVF
jgi:hypothetical protein